MCVIPTFKLNINSSGSYWMKDNIDSFSCYTYRRGMILILPVILFMLLRHNINSSCLFFLCC